MPGLFGMIKNEKNNSFHFSKMVDSLVSEWTTIVETWKSPHDECAMGRTNLGIFQHEQQPVIRDGFVMFFQGEIVNQQEISEKLSLSQSEKISDQDLILSLYIKDGYDAFRLLNGSYSIAIWDELDEKLILVTDYAGLRPLFYLQSGMGFCFASEIKAILSLGWITPQVNHITVLEYFTFGFTQGDETLIKYIKRIPPGTVLVFKDGQIEFHEFFQVSFKPEDSLLTDEDHKNNIAELLEKSLLSRCISSESIGLTLSGGMDTRLLAAICKSIGLNFPTFTYGQENSRDQRRAKKISKIIKFPHFSYLLDDDYLERNANFMIDRCEGRVDVFLSHGLYLNNMRNIVEIMMLGNGGEYLFGTGRDYFPNDLEVIPDQPYETYFRARNMIFKEVDWPVIFEKKLLRYADQPRERLFSLLRHYNAENIDDAIDTYRFNIVQMNRTLQGLNMINHALEFTEPYFDRDLVIYAMKIPFSLRRKRVVHNALLESYNPNLAKLEGGPNYTEPPFRKFFRRNGFRLKRRLVMYGLMDKKNIARPSSTFSDLNYLLRLSSTREFVEHTLLSKKTRIYEFIQPEFVANTVDAHMKANDDLSRQINRLVTFELFLQRYIA